MSATVTSTGSRPIKKGRLSINLASNIANLALSTVVGIFYVPFLVRTLGPEVYGLIPLASVMTSYMGVITLALNAAVGRSITVAVEQGNDVRANLIFNTSLWGSLSLGGALLVPCVLVVVFLNHLVSIPAGFETEARFLFGAIAVAFLLNQIKTPFEVSTFCRNRFDLRNLVEVSELLVRVGLIIGLFLIYSPRVSHVGMAILLGTVCSMGGVVLLWRILTPGLRVHWRAFHWPVLKELTRTGSWYVVNHLGALLYVGVDLIVANRMFGPETSGRYAAVLQLPFFIRTIGSSIGPIFAPPLLYYFARDDIPGLMKFLRWSVKLMGLLMVLPVALTCGFAGPLLNLWLGPGFGKLAPLLFIMAIHLCINMAVNPLLTLQLTADRVKVPAIVTLGVGIGNLLLAIALANVWGIYGVAAAGAIIITSRNIFFTPTYAARILNCRVRTFFLPLIPCVAATIATTAVCYGITRWIGITAWTHLIGWSLAVSLVYLWVAYHYLLDASERASVRELVARWQTSRNATSRGSSEIEHATDWNTDRCSTDGLLMEIRKLILPIFLFEAILLAGFITVGVLRWEPGAQFGELRIGTMWSVLQLLVISWFAHRIWRIRRTQSKSSWKSAAAIWLLISLGFAFLGADELFGIHETIDYNIHRFFHLQETAWSDRIDDLLIALYGVAGIGTILAYRRELVHYKLVLPFLLYGLGMFFGMVLLDVMTNRSDLLEAVFTRTGAAVLHTWLGVAEDSLKLVTEAVFILAAYASFRLARQLSGNRV